MNERRIVRSPKQRKAWEILSDASLCRIFFHGGARSGKTDVVLLWLVSEMFAHAGARILVARKHLDHARNTIWNNSLKKMVGGINGFSMSESTMELRHDNGSVLRVGGLDDQERVDKILGDEYLHIFINEATQITYDTMQTVLTRLSQNITGATCRKLIMDCNPKSHRHWLYRVGIQRLHPEKDEPLTDAAQWADMHWTPFDNPYLPPDYITGTLENLTGTKRRRMLDGVWCDNEGAVYEEFDEDVHVVDPFEPPKDWRVIRGIDFGFTNPFVCLWGAIDPDGRLYIFRERYKPGVLTSDHATAILAIQEREPVWYTVSDHDAEERAELHNRGIPTRAAAKAVETGIQSVKDRLAVQKDGMPRLFICSNCTNTLSEFYNYVWEPQRDGRNAKEEPRKEHDHAMDCLRYMSMSLAKGNRMKMITAD